MLLLASSCGAVHLGNTGANDQAPNAPVLAQGPFTGTNGKTVAGLAAVYDLGNGKYITRLDGIETPSENGLYVVTIANGVQVNSQALRSTSGSQNYSFTASNPGTFNQVKIRSLSLNLDYGIAPLQ